MNIRFRKNIWLLILILVCTVINGLVPAISSILFGRIFHLLDDNSDKVDYNTKRKQLVIRTMSILILGMGNLPFNWLAIYGWMMLGERQSYIIRKSSFMNISIYLVVGLTSTGLISWVNLLNCIDA